MYNSFHNLMFEPFSELPYSEFFWAGDNQTAALGGMRKHILSSKQGVILLSGAEGDGKSTLVSVLTTRIIDKLNVCKVIVQDSDKLAFLKSISQGFHLNLDKISNKIDFFIAFTEHIENIHHTTGKKALLIIDDAHKLTTELLEEISQLAEMEINRKKFFSILFVGNTELEETLKSSQHQILNENLLFHCKTKPLLLEDTKIYIEHRLKVAGNGSQIFNDDALDMIHTLANGNMKHINALCSEALKLSSSKALSIIDDHIIEEAQAINEASPEEREKKKEIKNNKKPSSKRSLQSQLVAFLALISLGYIGYQVIQQNNINLTEVWNNLTNKEDVVSKNDNTLLSETKTEEDESKLLNTVKESTSPPAKSEQNNLVSENDSIFSYSSDSPLESIQIQPLEVKNDSVFVAAIEIALGKREPETQPVLQATVADEQNESESTATPEVVQNETPAETVPAALTNKQPPTNTEKTYKNEDFKAAQTTTIKAATVEDILKVPSTEPLEQMEKQPKVENSKLNNTTKKLAASEQSPQVITYSPIEIKQPTLIAKKKVLAPQPINKDEPLKIVATKQKILMFLPEKPLYLQAKPNSDFITDDAVKLLEDYTRLVLLHPKASILIEGYIASDNDSAANTKLSERRANVIKKFMLEKGVSEDQITVVGRGNQNPIESNATPAGRRMNRRVEISVTENPAQAL